MLMYLLYIYIYVYIVFRQQVLLKMTGKDLELSFYKPFHICKQDVTTVDEGCLEMVWNLWCHNEDQKYQYSYYNIRDFRQLVNSLYPQLWQLTKEHEKANKKSSTSNPFLSSLIKYAYNTHTHTHTHIYIYIYIYTHIYIYIYTHTQPLHTSRMQHEVNFWVAVWIQFFLLDWWRYQG